MTSSSLPREQGTAVTNVPFVDLAQQRDEVAHEVSAGFAQVLAGTSFVMGPAVTRFEDAYAAYCGVSHAVGVGNGTDAIELALRAAGVGVGDEVILPANTFVATAEAVSRAGADIVLVDCGPDFTIDVDAVSATVTDRTRAVIPVHLYGQLADVESLRAVVGPDVLVIEDAAQSQGAHRDGRRSGALGDLASTSFYPGKNLGAYGDAGAVTTSDPELAQKLRDLRNHGGSVKYEHNVIGVNSRLDSLQAVVLSAKLAHLDRWNGMRRDAAGRYDATLADLPQVIRPSGIGSEAHVWHLYVIRVAQRDQVLASLSSQQIGSGIHYPVPVHLTRAYRHLGYGPGAFPVAEAAASEILSLPMFPHISERQQARVVEALDQALTSADPMAASSHAR